MSQEKKDHTTNNVVFAEFSREGEVYEVHEDSLRDRINDLLDSLKDQLGDGDDPDQELTILEMADALASAGLTLSRDTREAYPGAGITEETQTYLEELLGKHSTSDDQWPK
jgi:hypothetical protein